MLKVEHLWVINIPLLYIELIIYPCSNPDAGLDNHCPLGVTWVFASGEIRAENRHAFH